MITERSLKILNLHSDERLTDEEIAKEVGETVQQVKTTIAYYRHHPDEINKTSIKKVKEPEATKGEPMGPSPKPITIEIVRLYKDGKERPEISKLLNVSTLTIKNALNRAVAKGELTLRGSKRLVTNTITPKQEATPEKPTESVSKEEPAEQKAFIPEEIEATAQAIDNPITPEVVPVKESCLPVIPQGLPNISPETLAHLDAIYQRLIEADKRMAAQEKYRNELNSISDDLKKLTSRLDVVMAGLI
jgi:hypothetical protein